MLPRGEDTITNVFNFYGHITLVVVARYTTMNVLAALAESEAFPMQVSRFHRCTP